MNNFNVIHNSYNVYGYFKQFSCIELLLLSNRNNNYSHNHTSNKVNKKKK